MARALSILLDTLYTLAAALWFGLLAGLFVMAHPGSPDPTLDLFAHRASGLIEAAGVAMVGVQFLLRRRYARIRQLAVADSVRQLLTFGALFLAEFGRYGLLKPGVVLTANHVTTLCQLAGAQMVVLVVVTGLTSWLLMPRAVAGIKAKPIETGSNRPVAPSASENQQQPGKPTPRQRRK